MSTRRYTSTQTMLDAIGILTATFTAAVTNIITANTHGLKNGDRIVLTTSDTLPAGLATGTIYYVKEATTNTFKVGLSTEDTVVDITGTGTGTHTFTMHDVAKAINVEDFRYMILSYDTAASCNVDIKFQGSIQDTEPDFSAAQTVANQWDYIEVNDMQDGAAIDGDTGISLTGTDDHRMLEANVNGLKWICAILSGWSAGAATLKVKLFND